MVICSIGFPEGFKTQLTMKLIGVKYKIGLGLFSDDLSIYLSQHLYTNIHLKSVSRCFPTKHIFSQILKCKTDELEHNSDWSKQICLHKMGKQVPKF